MENEVKVLDKGYVRLIDVMGSDLSVVNAARVSFARESKELTKKDKRLIHFLARNGHTSPFRHAMATFEVKAPLMVARQWWKYVVGSDHTMDGWNEVSRRYVVDGLEFYIPSAWRKAPENKKQGSGEDLDPDISDLLSKSLEAMVAASASFYRYAVEKKGVCAEQARMFLLAYPLYVEWRWTASLQSICHFLNQRLAPDAQWEIRQYAQAVETLIRPRFPVSVEALVIPLSNKEA